jgi:hypothetical protein
MKFFTTVRKRLRSTRIEWTARLVYEDQITGKRKELSKSAPSDLFFCTWEEVERRSFISTKREKSSSHLKIQVASPKSTKHEQEFSWLKTGSQKRNASYLPPSPYLSREMILLYLLKH